MKNENLLKTADIVCLMFFVVATGFVVAFKFAMKLFLLKTSFFLYIFAFASLIVFNLLKLISIAKSNEKEKSSSGIVIIFIKIFFCIIVIGFTIYLLTQI